MPNILLTRIDNRLVHGQVGITWTRQLGANLIVVADDDSANDQLQQALMKVTADSMNVGIRFFTLQKTIDVIGKASESQKIFLIVRNPQSARVLVEGGVPIKELNLGNLHFSVGKREISSKVYLDAKDEEDLAVIKSNGVNVFIQDVPNEKIIPY